MNFRRVDSKEKYYEVFSDLENDYLHNTELTVEELRNKYNLSLSYSKKLIKDIKNKNGLKRRPIKVC